MWTTLALNVCPRTGALRFATGKNRAVFEQFTNVSLDLAEPVFSCAGLASFTRHAKIAGSSLRKIQDSYHSCLPESTVKDVADLFIQTPYVLQTILNDRYDYFKMIGTETNSLPPEIPGCNKGFKVNWKSEVACQEKSSARYNTIKAKQLEHANNTLMDVERGAQIIEELALHLVFIHYIVDIASYNRDPNHLDYFQRLVGSSSSDQCSLPNQIEAYRGVFKKYGTGVYVDIELAAISIAHQLRLAHSRLKRLTEEAGLEKPAPPSWIVGQLKGYSPEKIDPKFLTLDRDQITDLIRARKHVLREIREMNDNQRSAVANALGQAR